MTSDRAKQLMADTGAGIYWQGQEEATARIAADREKFFELNGILAGE